MQLFIDSYGAYLGVKDEMFWVKPQHSTPQLVAVPKVKCIFLTRGVSVSTNAMRMAIENSIPMLLLDAIGKPIGQVWSGQFGSIATIRRNQAFFAESNKGIDWIKKIIEAKVLNQIQLLKYYEKEQKSINPYLLDLEIEYEKLRRKVIDFTLPKSEIKATLRGLEGFSGKCYFKALNFVLPKNWQFPTRSTRPAKDMFNCILNYMYGMLYSFVELSLMKAGVDPYVGVLHADQHRKPAMVFDIIECYRIYVDEACIALAQHELLSEQDFQRLDGGGMWLGNSGKPIVIQYFSKFLEAPVRGKKEKHKRTTQIDLDSFALATILKKYNHE
ncbi:CRISPR-associated endonuclease Cas1 [Flammeovirga sp. SJP92]|uniref:CRISPR-associated endonuclease Cas1 n=1 Tax=Flammeovirga sp. SJP92 TaxID=1775430 RepID=UPI000787B9F7|nr:CRISPR-associated endonuclease Cas1 [Flammeovirga sp. SJP92]KXX69431.1 hypothetical protein AVL50_19330 [Flammeovirga sp. SJP92]